MSGTIGSTAH
jgi:hypothetical protein